MISISTSRYQISPEIVITLFIFLCGVSYGQPSGNPPLPGFNLQDSDPRAIEIADRVMEALGGRDNWDDTHYITWKFFGRRLHVWDKWSGDIRFENNGLLVLMNLHTRQGRAWQNNKEVTDPDSLRKKLSFANSAWINDSYWMFAPYKLKDSGVTLKYLGEGKTLDGRESYILQLTFEDVGDTPENKYHVYIDQNSYLMRQWDFFSRASDTEPRFSTPWANWQHYGNILLSDDRGKNHHSDIAVFEELPATVFESPAAIDMMSYVK